jgi:hypothetical protein
VEQERKRLSKLVSDQRQTASKYLNDADASIKNGDFSKALDLCVNAFVIAEKAAENTDLYDESKSQISLILSGLSFSLQGSPQFAYLEGDSDPVNVKVSSSKTGSGVAGIMTEAVEINSNANIGSKTGNITDNGGLVYYLIDKILDKNVKKININVSFSMNKFDKIRELDEDFYNDIKKFQKSQTLSFNLDAVNKDKSIPTAVAIVQILKDGKSVQKAGSVPKFQELVSGKLANQGYNLVSAEIPLDSLTQGKEEVQQIKDAIISYVKKKYPNAKRLLLGIREVNILGTLGQDIKFSEYNINDSDFKMVDMKFVMTINDIDTGKVEKGSDFSAKGQGLNIDQAIDNGEKRLLDDIDKKIKGF